MSTESSTFYTSGRVTLVLVLVAAFTPAWCPEGSVLLEAPERSLLQYMKTSPEEVSELLDWYPDLRGPAQVDAIIQAVDEASRQNGLPPELLLAVISAESGFRRTAVSHKGAVGLMQLMPRTAEELASQLDMDWTGELMLHEPQANIAMGAHYLRRLLSSFGDLDRALAAYNRGPNAVGRDGAGPWCLETTQYVQRVKDSIERQGLLDRPREMGAPRPFELSAYLDL